MSEFQKSQVRKVPGQLGLLHSKKTKTEQNGKECWGCGSVEECFSTVRRAPSSFPSSVRPKNKIKELGLARCLSGYCYRSPGSILWKKLLTSTCVVACALNTHTRTNIKYLFFNLLWVEGMFLLQIYLSNRVYARHAHVILTLKGGRNRTSSR